MEFERVCVVVFAFYLAHEEAKGNKPYNAGLWSMAAFLTAINWHI